MKIAILGDSHFGVRGDSPFFHKHFKQFYEEVFFPFLEKNNILHVIQLGDVFDRRKFINFQTLEHCRSYFFDKINKDFTSWMLVGNHDTYYKNTNKVNSLNLLLNEYHNINKINSPTEVVFEDVGVLMVPWICGENFNEVMHSMKSSKSQILIGHFEINGFEMHKGAFCDRGIDPEIFNKFDLVISGHFHTKSTRSNIVYTGTPYEMTWSDFEDQKGFHIFDTSTRELEFIPNSLRMFHKLWYDDSNCSMDEIIAYDFTKYKDTIVKVIIKNKVNPAWFDLFIEKLEKVGLVDLQVVEDHLNLNLEDDSDIVNEAEDTLTILNKYVTQLELRADKTKLENLLRTLYNEALSME